MNVKWLKQNAMIVGFGAVFLVLLGGVIWWWQMASAKGTEVNTALEEQMSQLQHLLQTKPGPSRENIEIVKRDREQVESLYSNLLANVGRSRIDVPPDLRPVGFLQLMASSFARLRQAADANNVKLADGFAFGFGRYAGPPPQLPARSLPDEETKRVLGLLVKQLAAIDRISTLLITNHVDEITQIRRSEVEPSSGTATFDVPISHDPKALYEVFPFEFVFACSSESLRGFLNSLTQSDWFFVVRRVQITGEPPSTEKPSTQAGGRAAAPAPAKRPILSVTARVDLIEFPSQPPPKTEAARPAPAERESSRR